MAQNPTTQYPLTIRETLFIITLFLIVFGLIFIELLPLFYLGLSILILMIFEKVIGVLFYPHKSKEMFFLDRFGYQNPQLKKIHEHPKQHSRHYLQEKEWAKRGELDGWPTGI